MLQYALIFESVRMKILFLFISFLFIVLSPLSSFCIFLFSLRHSLSLPSQSSLLKISLIFAQDLLPPHLAVNLHSPHRRPLQPLPPTFRSLNRVVGVIFGMGFDVWVLGHWLIGWVGILGRWWSRGCGGGWLSFGSAMFVVVVGGSVVVVVGFDVWVLGHWLIGWVGILGQWWCRGCGGGWLSFGSAMFVAVVGGGVCGCSGPTVFVEDFEFLFLFLFFFVEVFWFGIC